MKKMKLQYTPRNKEKPKQQQCVKCKKIYPYTEEYWHKNNQRRWGLHGECKICRLQHKKMKTKQKRILREIANESEHSTTM